MKKILMIAVLLMCGGILSAHALEDRAQARPAPAPADFRGQRIERREPLEHKQFPERRHEAKDDAAGLAVKS